MPDIAAAKRRLRAESRTLRAQSSAPPQDAIAAARRFLLEVPFVPDAVFAGYWPLPGEFDPRPLLHALAARGHVCALPVTVAPDAPLLFRRWEPSAPLQSGRYGISQPSPEAPEVVPDWLLVPLLAFDRAGFRLGQGAGYYDRTLAALRASGRPVQAVGLAFAAQEVAEVPRDDHDEPLDWIVTERDILKLGGRGETAVSG
jgi:5-formyltetrahydrofolate cyclo-ligase